MAVMRVVTLFLLALAVAPGCGPLPWEPDAGLPLDAGPRGACMGPPGSGTTVILGTGMTSFRTLPDGAEVPWEAGPQGGHHVWVTLRARGVLQAATRTTFRAEDATQGGLLLVERAVPFVLDAEEGGWCTLAGIRLQLDEDPAQVIRSLEGHLLRLSVEVSDEDGRGARDQRTITLVAPAGAPDAGGTDGG